MSDETVEVTIRVPKSAMVLDGIQYEPTGEYRKPKSGDAFLPSNADRVCVAGNCIYDFRHFILRPAYQWPAVLKNFAAIAMDEDGEIYAYEEMPAKKCEYWETDGIVLGEAMRLLEIPLPTITDWTKPVLNPARAK